MTKNEVKLLKLKARRVSIITKGNYRESRGVLNKVERQIKALETC